MEVNFGQIVSACALTLVLWFARQVVNQSRDFESFKVGTTEWRTAIDNRVTFIYDRLRFAIVTDIKSNPHAVDERLEELAQRFIARTITHAELRELIVLLEERKLSHAIEKERMKAENFLSLIHYEYQL